MQIELDSLTDQVERNDKGWISWADWQKLHKFKEVDYPVPDGKYPYGCGLDPANPGFYVKDHRLHGKALRSDYKIRRDKKGLPLESAVEYWKRVSSEITIKRKEYERC